MIPAYRPCPHTQCVVSVSVRNDPVALRIVRWLRQTATRDGAFGVAKRTRGFVIAFQAGCAAVLGIPGKWRE